MKFDIKQIFIRTVDFIFILRSWKLAPAQASLNEFLHRMQSFESNLSSNPRKARCLFAFDVIDTEPMLTPENRRAITDRQREHVVKLAN